MLFHCFLMLTSLGLVTSFIYDETSSIINVLVYRIDFIYCYVIC